MWNFNEKKMKSLLKMKLKKENGFGSDIPQENRQEILQEMPSLYVYGEVNEIEDDLQFHGEEAYKKI